MKSSDSSTPGTGSRGITLALNAAEARLQICAADAQGELLFAQSWHAPSRGVELLAPALQQALSLSEYSPKDITRIACVRGPGSFTGLRLVLISAAGLARACGAQLAGIDYMPLLALNILHSPQMRQETKPSPEPLWIITHARRNLVHAQAFAPLQSPVTSLEHIRPLTELLVLQIQDALPENLLATHIAALGGSPVLAGSGATKNQAELAAQLQERQISFCFSGSLYDHPTLDSLLLASQSAHYGHEDLQALYARPCDAEENLPRIAEKLGLNPEEARKRLRELTASLNICE